MFKHLDEVDKTYVEHMLEALEGVLYLQLVSIALLIHAFIPCIFKRTFSTFIKKAYFRLT